MQSPNTLILLKCQEECNKQNDDSTETCANPNCKHKKCSSCTANDSVDGEVQPLAFPWVDLWVCVGDFESRLAPILLTLRCSVVVAHQTSTPLRQIHVQCADILDAPIVAERTGTFEKLSIAYGVSEEVQSLMRVQVVESTEFTKFAILAPSVRNSHLLQNR